MGKSQDSKHLSLQESSSPPTNVKKILSFIGPSLIIKFQGPIKENKMSVSYVFPPVSILGEDGIVSFPDKSQENNLPITYEPILT